MRNKQSISLEFIVFSPLERLLVKIYKKKRERESIRANARNFYERFSAVLSLSLFHVGRCANNRSKVKGSTEKQTEEMHQREQREELFLFPINLQSLYDE